MPPPRRSLCFVALILGLCGLYPLGAALEWSTFGEARVRADVKDNAGGGPANADFLPGDAADADYLFFRTTAGVAVDGGEWAARLSVRDARPVGDAREPSPLDNPVDLFEAYLVLRPTEALELKLGHQEIRLGSQIVIGGTNYNTGRIYEALRADLALGEQRWTLAGGRILRRDKDAFDEAGRGEWFWALQGALPGWLENELHEVLIAGRHLGGDARAAPRDILVGGLRWRWEKPEDDGFWGEAEAYVQWGSRQVLGERVEHRAWLVSGKGGYHWPGTWGAPHLALLGNLSPGDPDPGAGRSETWDLFYSGGNHARSGRMDLVSWRNSATVGVEGGLKPSARLTVQAQVLGHWIETTGDLFYPQGGSGRQGNGYGAAPGADARLGTEFLLWSSWDVAEGWNVLFDLGWFEPGPYLESVLAGSGGPERALFGSLWLRFQW